MLESLHELWRSVAEYPSGVLAGGGLVLFLLCWLLWKAVQRSVAFIMGALLLSIVGFAGYVIFTS